jgi:hypothetical protein
MPQIDMNDFPVYSCVALGESLGQALGEQISHCSACWIALVEEKRLLATAYIVAPFASDGSDPRVCAIVQMCCQCANSLERRRQLGVIAIARVTTGNPFPKVDPEVLRSVASDEDFREYFGPEPSQMPEIKPTHATSGSMFGPSHRQEKPD